MRLTIFYTPDGGNDHVTQVEVFFGRDEGKLRIEWYRVIDTVC